MLQVLFGTIMEDSLDLSTRMAYSTETEEHMESEPNITADTTASVIVKLELPDDSEISTANNQHSAIHFQDATIKTEPINRRNLACDDDTSHADAKTSMEYKGICFKHEYKYEEDSASVMVHNVEVGHSVFVKSEMPYDTKMPTSDFTHNECY
jgi:hypothetical protein